MSIEFENVKDRKDRKFRFRLGALFFVMTLCGCFWGLLALIGANLTAYIVCSLGLGFLAFSVLAVASGRRGIWSKISIAIASYLLLGALMKATLGF